MKPSPPEPKPGAAGKKPDAPVRPAVLGAAPPCSVRIVQIPRPWRFAARTIDVAGMTPKATASAR